MIIVFLLLACITLWASIVAFFGFSSIRVRNIFFACLIAAAVTAFWMTFRFAYSSPDGNIHVGGWPVPSFIAQKNVGDKSWKLIGGTSVIAFPLNYFLFMLVPSVIVLVTAAVARFRRNDR